MVTYKPTKWKELEGEFNAVLTEILVDENKYFDPTKDNSTEQVLHITFELEDPETFESTLFTQRYVNPLTNGNGLFQQLLNAANYIPDLEGGQFDEQTLVGLKVKMKIGKNKKGWAVIEKVEKLS